MSDENQDCDELIIIFSKYHFTFCTFKSLCFVNRVCKSSHKLFKPAVLVNWRSGNQLSTSTKRLLESFFRAKYQKVREGHS
jgi:hypothetical protein